MKLLHCPLNGPRNIDEFQSFGPVRPDPGDVDDAAWAAHLFHAENRLGTITEWWRHIPSNTVFLAERDIVTDIVLRTWLPG
ncbi:MAG: sarcosine oxidase subunit delta [Gemmobacter sp.]